MTDAEREEMTSKARAYSMQFGRESVWGKLKAKVEVARALKDAQRLPALASSMGVHTKSEVFEVSSSGSSDEELVEAPAIAQKTATGPPRGLATNAGPAHDSRNPMVGYN